MKKILIFALAGLVFYSCATVSPYAKQGELYLLKGKYDEAVAAYQRAVEEDPLNPQYKAGLYKAKLSAAIHYWMKGEEALGKGDKTKALAYYRKALYYQPSNEAVVKRVESLTGKKVEKRRVTHYRKARPKVSLHFSNAKLKTIFQALGKYAGVNLIFDEGFRNIRYSISMENVDFEDALRLLCASTQNFYYKIDDKNYLIIPDTPQKREQYLAKKVKIFYLRYSDVKSIRVALATMVITRMRRAINISYDQNLNAVIVKGTDEQIEYIAQLIERLDRPKGEVIIQAEILEVNRSKLIQAGLDFSQYAVGAGLSVSSSDEESTNGGGESSSGITLNTLRNLTGDDIAVIMPTAYLRFLETNTETRVMARPLLRGIDGDKVTLKIGNKVPIPQTTFSPIAAGGLNIQPVTSFQYQDVGIIMEMEPRINSKDEVTLKIKFEVSSIAGKGYNDLPVLGNREVEMTARVKGGETVIIAGLFRNQESQTVKSPPFFSKIPLLGWLFSNAEAKREQTDVVIAITPYIVNYVEPSREEEKAIITSEGRGLKLEGKKEEAPSAPQQPPTSKLKQGKKAVLNIFPKRVFVSKGSDFSLSLTYRGEPIKSGEIVVEFSPDLELVDVVPGAFLDNQSFLKNKENHRVLVGFTIKGNATVKVGQLAVLKFKLKGEQGEVSVVSATLRDQAQQPIILTLPEPVQVSSRR